MRLIDADRAASIENLDQYSDLAAALGDVQTVRDILSDAPTIDAVPVVRKPRVPIPIHHELLHVL